MNHPSPTQATLESMLGLGLEDKGNGLIGAAFKWEAVSAPIRAGCLPPKRAGDRVSRDGQWKLGMTGKDVGRD